MGRIQGRGRFTETERSASAIVTVRTVLALVCAAASCFAVVCCQQALSIDGSVRVAQTVNTCGIQVPVAGNCAACVGSQCCAQATTCAGDPACLALETCLLGCASDYACRSNCITAYPVERRPDIPALDTCVAASCNDPCGLICGVPGSYTTPDVAQDCQECIEFSGCGATEACTRDLACETAAECAYACTTPDCRAACAADAGATPAIATLLDAAFTVGPDCYFRCKWGQNWTCVGKAGPPQAQAQGVPQSVDLSLSDNGSGVPGVSVQACGAADDACATPLASGTSDAQGNVTLEGLPPAGLYGFEGFFLLQSPSIPKTMSFLSFPLSVEHAQLTVLLLASTELSQDLADVGIASDPLRGHVLVFVQDCMQLPAPGVTVAAVGLNDPEAQAVYFSGVKPTTSLTSTSATGAMMFVDLKPGQLLLQATPTATGQVASHATVYVGAGMLSIVTMMPASN
jgi:hypothetical protein